MPNQESIIQYSTCNNSLWGYVADGGPGEDVFAAAQTSCSVVNWQDHPQWEKADNSEKKNQVELQPKINAGVWSTATTNVWQPEGKIWLVLNVSGIQVGNPQSQFSQNVASVAVWDLCSYTYFNFQKKFTIHVYQC